MGVDAVMNCLEFVFDGGAIFVFILKFQIFLYLFFCQAFQAVDLVVSNFDFVLFVFIGEPDSVFLFLERFARFFALFRFEVLAF